VAKDKTVSLDIGFFVAKQSNSGFIALSTPTPSSDQTRCPNRFHQRTTWTTINGKQTLLFRKQVQCQSTDKSAGSRLARPS
jgi:hypothetical protein